MKLSKFEFHNKVNKEKPEMGKITETQNVVANAYAYYHKYKKETSNNHLIFLE
jgi:hypothetical protein